MSDTSASVDQGTINAAIAALAQIFLSASTGEAREGLNSFIVDLCVAYTGATSENDLRKPEDVRTDLSQYGKARLQFIQDHLPNEVPIGEGVRFSNAIEREQVKKVSELLEKSGVIQGESQERARSWAERSCRSEIPQGAAPTR